MKDNTFLSEKTKNTRSVSSSSKLEEIKVDQSEILDNINKQHHQKNKNDIEFAQPQDIAEEIFRISQQKRSAWSFDVELRPDIEKW